ncbi:deoxyribonuclease IV [Lachnotalea sp. AF33-28]|jgi:deoxyribonuclease-4|uniref:deoxyribonuclease IV n=1 Tax=Lachnotalea sp. AF33-28 TaxID=2292046 RepID=UPI000E504530|nr:deoxyribonuclease IV [Lachnotalea sp. AF33-28]RHP34892.1 deoxyribonuclease IV [Lachnotalea sp. AF33-28]
MLKIGCHLSISKGYLAMGEEAVRIGANTFQFFSRNPRGGNVRALDIEDIRRYLDYAKEHEISVILAHAPYTLNGCSAEEKTRGFAVRAMKEDLERMEYLPGNLYNFHPGSHVKQGTETGIQYIVEMLNTVLWPDMHTTVLLETMAGKGSEVGGRFEELRAILDGVKLSEKMGVCLDTCHVFDGGYDIAHSLDAVLDEFDRIIGMDRLKAVHLNDSKNVLGSRKDRHAKIGEGNIGAEALVRMMNHPDLKKLPFYLETPNDLDGYAAEIKMLCGHYQEEM